MGKTLITTEKPSASRDVVAGLGERFQNKEGYYESESYVVVHCFGHLISLQEPAGYDAKYEKWRMADLPIIPEPFKYGVIKKSAKQFAIIKRLIARADVDRVVNAGDAGREGELIQRLVYMMAGNRKPVFRFWTSKALTPEAVREAFANLKPASAYDRLFQSALARQHADWLVGINASRGFSLRFAGNYSMGRVQTPVLRLLVDREEEIGNFKPLDYWILKAKFDHANGEYEGVWFVEKKNKKDQEDAAEEGEDKEAGFRITTEELAAQIKARIEGKTGAVKSCKQQNKEDLPPLLFSLTVLQQEANKQFGFTAGRTLEIAQTLYEKHLLTYPRSESQYLNDEIEAEVKRTVRSLASGPVRFDPAKCTVSAKNKRIFNSAKLTDHHAVIPTDVSAGTLSADERKVYELVVRRFIAAFYPAHKYSSTTIVTQVGEDTFKTVGRMVTDPGWKAIYGSKDKDIELPEVKAKDPVAVLDVSTEKKQTQPPSRYTDASILDVMKNAQKYVTDAELKKKLKESAGIGTPATRAAILDVLIAREYINRKGKLLIPTDKARFLISRVREEQIADVAYTAMWEQELDAIANGEVHSPDAFMREIKKYAEEIVEKAKQAETRDKPEGGNGSAKTSIGTCPECGKPVAENAKSFYCSGYKEGCKFAIWKNTLSRLGKKMITAGQVTELLNGNLIALKGLKSKTTGKKFNASGKLVKKEKFGWGIDLVFNTKEPSTKSAA